MAGATRDSLGAMPSRRDARTYDLKDLRDRVMRESGGAVDDSIPQLAEADPELLGIAIVLPDGSVRTTEQADVAFSVQSAVKPFLFALALLDTDENRYLIPDLAQLPERDRTLFQRYIYW